MWYLIIRIVLVLVVIIVLTTIFVRILKKIRNAKNENIKSIKVRFSTRITCMLLMPLLIIVWFPIESSFLSFDSPEDVFNYYSFGGEIQEVIYGNNSAMILYSSGGNSWEAMFIPKTVNGYKIPGFRTVRSNIANAGSVVYAIYRVSNTSDYYIVGSFFVDGDVIIVCSVTGETIVETMVGRGSEHFLINSFHAFIDNWQDSYEVMVVQNESD